MADFLEGKNPVTVAMVAVIIVVAVIAVFAGNLTGYATSDTTEVLLFPEEGIHVGLYVGEFGHNGWGDCTGAIPWEAVNRLCIQYGYPNGALPEEGTASPCRHDAAATAYMWDLVTPMHRGAYDTQNGYALTAIMCLN